MPSKITRFLVTGSTAECVNQFIYLLSYFLRCSDVNEAIVEDLVGREFGDEKIRTLKEDRISSTPSLSKRSRHSSSEIHTLQTTKIPTELSSASKKPKELRQDLEAISQRSPSKVSNDNSQNSSCSSHAFSKEQAKELAEKLAILQSSRERNSDVKESGILDGDVNCDCTCGVKNKTTLPTSSEDFASPGTSYFAQDYLEAHTSEFFNEPSRPAHKMLRRRSGGENFCSSQGRSSDALNPFFIRHKHLRSSGSEKGRIFGRGALKQRNFSCPVFRGSISQSPKASVNRAAEDLVKRTVKARHNPPIAGLLDPGDKQLASSPPRNSVIRSVPVSRKVSTADGIIGSCGRFDVIPISAPVNIYEPTSSSTVSSQCTVRYAGSIDSLEVSKQNETGDIADFAVVSHKTSVTLSTRKTSLGYGTGTDPSVSASILCTHRTSESIGMGESAIEEQICPDFYQLDSEGNRSDADSLADNSQSQLDGQHTKYSVDSGIEENDAMDFARSGKLGLIKNSIDD